MERFSKEKEQDLFPDKTNKQNLDRFIKHVLPFFFYRKEDNERIKNRLETGGTEDEKYLDDLFELNNQCRAWFKVNDIRLIDSSFDEYSRHIYKIRRSIERLIDEHDLPVGGFDKFMDALRSRETFYSNKIEVGNQTFKLFKFLINNHLMSKTDAEYYTSQKVKSDNFAICISRNPIDYLFVSTNQSFGSCISLDSNNPGYMGLGGLCLDPNRFLVFLTSMLNNKSEYNIKNTNLTHLRYTSRSWALFGKKDIVTIRKYPRDLPFYQSVLDYLSEKTSMSNIDNIRSSPSSITFESKFKFETPKHSDNLQESMIYLDGIGLSTSKGKRYYSRSGRTGNLYLQYSGKTFHSINDLEDFYYIRRQCNICKKLHRDGNCIRLNTGYICIHCYEKTKVKCDNCGEYGIKNNTMFYYKYNIIYPGNRRCKKLCTYCTNRLFNCEVCNKLSYNRVCHRCSSQIIIPRYKYKAGDKVKIHSKDYVGDYRSLASLKRTYGEDLICRIEEIYGDGSGINFDNCIILGGNFFHPNDISIVELRVDDIVRVIGKKKVTLVTEVLKESKSVIKYKIKGYKRMFELNELEHLG